MGRRPYAQGVNESRARAASVAAVLTGIAGSQVGAGIGATLIPSVGPFVVVALRQIAAAVSLLILARPRVHRRRVVDILPALLLGVVMGVMNNAVYLSIERLGVGLTITLEFLGPLTIALLASRRLVDVLCAVGAGAGVALLMLGPVRLDGLGIVFGLIGAAAWASYILLNRRIGSRLPGFEGSAIAATTSAVLFAPLGLLTLGDRELDLRIVLLGAVAGLLSSAVPFAIDMVVLRRIEPGVFGMLMSANPAFAALAGWLVAGELLSGLQWVAIGLITAVSVVALSRSARADAADSAVAPRPGDEAAA
jgi:inner membrane transporter RhtA